MKKIIVFPLFFILIIIALYLFQKEITFTKKTVTTNIQINPTINQNTSELTQEENLKNQTVSDNTSTQKLILEITEPVDKTIVNNTNLKIAGKTNSNTPVFINDKEIKSDVNGNFSTTVTLDEGENTFIIVANDDEGNFIEKEIMVTLETLQ